MDDIHKKWSHRWLSEKAEARSSDIEGLGVFAKEPILKGEEIGVLGGVIVHKSETKEYWNAIGDVGIQIDDNFFIVPTTRKELEEKGVFNHSCNPNIGFSNSITFIAIRDIEAGEELVFDYAFSETYDKALHNGMECLCGFEKCRKQLHFDDWKNPEIRKKYSKYFSPYLRDRL